jgi:hypothetical protein
MRWLKRTISALLALVAVGIIVAVGFSEHSGDYGRVSLPQGGVVHLPKGQVTVFDRFTGDPTEYEQNTAGLTFQVTPVGGGTPIAAKLENGDVSDTQVQRTETIGEFGAVAKLKVPSTGEYEVTGTSNLAPGAVYLDFGTNAGSALLARWKLIAALLAAAFILSVIPVPRSGRRLGRATDPTWSSDPRAPYAG